MSNGVDIEFSGLDELVRDFEKCALSYPDETVKAVRKAANEFKKDVNEKMPSSYSFKNKWRVSREKGTSVSEVGFEVQNKAPHWHLVENGHELLVSPSRAAALERGQAYHGQKRKSHKRPTDLEHRGFVPGRHYCADTRDEWKSGEFAKHMRIHIDKLLKEHDL